MISRTLKRIERLEGELDSARRRIEILEKAEHKRKLAMKNDDLKPCPGCGGKALETQNYADFRHPFCWHYQPSEITCLDCGTKMVHRGALEELKKKWNGEEQ